jgi:hypothetical protein
VEHSKPRRATTRTPLTNTSTLIAAFDGMLIAAYRAGLLDHAQVKRLADNFVDEVARKPGPAK